MMLAGELSAVWKNMAHAVESKITENEERNNKHGEVPTAIFTELNKITKVLTQSREEANNGLVTIDHSSMG